MLAGSAERAEREIRELQQQQQKPLPPHQLAEEDKGPAAAADLVLPVEAHVAGPAAQPVSSSTDKLSDAMLM